MFFKTESWNVWKRISWNLAKFQLTQLIQTIAIVFFFYLLSDWVEIFWGFTKFFFKQLLKVSILKNKRVLCIPKKIFKPLSNTKTKQLCLPTQFSGRFWLTTHEILSKSSAFYKSSKTSLNMTGFCQKLSSRSIIYLMFFKNCMYSLVGIFLPRTKCKKVSLLYVSLLGTNLSCLCKNMLLNISQGNFPYRHFASIFFFSLDWCLLMKHFLTFFYS